MCRGLTPRSILLPTARTALTSCAKIGPNQHENLSAWPAPDHPWQRIHIDFAGPFLDDMWLVANDAYSKWPHVLKLSKCPTSETTKSALDDLFAIWGLPETIVSDNGPQLVRLKYVCRLVQYTLDCTSNLI